MIYISTNIDFLIHFSCWSISSDYINFQISSVQKKRKEKSNFFKTKNNCVCFEKDIHYNNITLFWLHWFHLEYTLQLPKFCSKRYVKKQYKIQARRINLSVVKRANRGYFKLGVWRRFNPPAGVQSSLRVFWDFESSSSIYAVPGASCLRLIIKWRTYISSKSIILRQFMNDEPTNQWTNQESLSFKQVFIDEAF